jgi:hypothetical protein
MPGSFSFADLLLRGTGAAMSVLESREQGGDASGAALPPSVGPLSAFVADCLVRPAGDADAGRGDLRVLLEDAERDATEVEHGIGEDDLQLALYLCYELHYSSFCDVDPGWEWDPLLIRLRRALEGTFLTALRAEVPERAESPDRIGARLFELAAADEGASLGRFLERRGTLDHFREFAAQRSAYQLKEADPHTWAIPRLHGAPKAALVEVQADEYGGGRPDRMHSALFAKAMRALGLDDRPGAYLDRLPGLTLAAVNLISMFGLSRARRGALVGHLAMFEITSSAPNRRYANGLRRLGLGAEATDFFDEHVEADAVHENIAAYDLAEGLAKQEPALARDILFGAECLLWVESRSAEAVLARWGGGESSLRRPLPESSLAAA